MIFSLLLELSCKVLYYQRKSYSFRVTDNDRTQDDIHHFLFPLEKITMLDESAIAPLVELLKDDLDEIKLGALSLRTVLMTLRLLQHLTVEEKQEGLTDTL